MSEKIKFSALKKKKTYDETMLYSATVGLLKCAHTMCSNIPKQNRTWFGDDIIKNTKTIMKCYKDAYEESDIKRKLELMEKVHEYINSVAMDVKLLSELNVISAGQYGDITTKYMSLRMQTDNFTESIKKKIEE